MLKKGQIAAIAAGFFVIVTLIYGVAKHNSFVRLENKVSGEWSKVETQYQRRTDLVPNLVKTVAAFAKQEKEVLTTVTELRSKVGQLNVNLGDGQSVEEFVALQGQLTSALSRLLVVTENYPELRSQENFLELQAQLEGTENRIAIARDNYNEAVVSYRNAVGTAPASVVAKIFGHSESKFGFFQAKPGAEDAPVVDFGGD